MKDRVPTQVVDGAIRMEQLDSSGNSLGYIYLKRADEPSEAGTPLNKLTLLSDDTAAALCMDETDPTVSQALQYGGAPRTMSTIYSASDAVTNHVVTLPYSLAHYYEISVNLQYISGGHPIIEFLSESNAVLGSYRASGICNSLATNIEVLTNGTLAFGIINYTNNPYINLSPAAVSKIRITAGTGGSTVYGAKRGG